MKLLFNFDALCAIVIVPENFAVFLIFQLAVPEMHVGGVGNSGMQSSGRFHSFQIKNIPVILACTVLFSLRIK